MISGEKTIWIGHGGVFVKNNFFFFFNNRIRILTIEVRILTKALLGTCDGAYCF